MRGSGALFRAGYLPSKGGSGMIRRIEYRTAAEWGELAPHLHHFRMLGSIQTDSYAFLIFVIPARGYNEFR
jgi:hypothetical protein